MCVCVCVCACGCTYVNLLEGICRSLTSSAEPVLASVSGSLAAGSVSRAGSWYTRSSTSSGRTCRFGISIEGQARV